jgi:hypothetical protein
MQIMNDIKTIQKFGIKIIVEHVRGHQDKTKQFNDLNRPEQFNVQVEQYAINYVQFGKTVFYDKIPGNIINLYLSDNFISRHFKHELQKASSSAALQAYMLIRFDWQSNVPDMI